MNPGHIEHMVVVGGGTAGWMTAAAFSRFLNPAFCRITLVESDQIASVGVGEATIPHIRFFHTMLGIDENEFMRAVGATYKLGIEFSDWYQLGESYMHPFGAHGRSINGVDFHHYWLKARQTQARVGAIDAYSLAIAAAKADKFAYPSPEPDSPLSSYSYAFHLDASLYAQFLRRFAESNGVNRIEGKVVGVQQNPDNGFLKSIELESGESVDGELFVDCSGFRGLLVEQQLMTGFDDWSCWLPCDRAVAVPSARKNAAPYTKAVAESAGWRWRIPLQHRTGNGYVYCSDSIGDDDAAHSLLHNIDEPLEAEPKFLRFRAGRRKKSWNKNCVAVGLSGGFLEPLESTSIYLIQVAIMKLMDFFPDRTWDPVDAEEFNRLLDIEYRRIRDFLILHYKANSRHDAEFWQRCRAMDIPIELEDKIELFRERGVVQRYEQGLFMTPSWVAVFLGQGVIPQSYDPRVDALTSERIRQHLQALEGQLSDCVRHLPSHRDALRENTQSLTQYPPGRMSLYGAGR